MSSANARNWLFILLTISVFSFALGISVGYALWYKAQVTEPVIIPTKIVEQPPVEIQEEEPVEVAAEPIQDDQPINTDSPEDIVSEEVAEKIVEQEPSEEVAVEEFLEPIDVARHLFISVNGQWLAEGTQRLISEIQPGGVVLQERNIKNAAQTRSLIDEIKKYAGSSKGGIYDWPIIAISHEGGAQNTLRLDVSPDAATLASYQNDTTVEKLGQIYARDAYSRGIGVMLGPVFDLYDEGGFDPSYALRAFGADQTQVTSLGLAMAAGIRSEGMLPVVKYFPGYGSATYDVDGIQLTLNKDVSDLAKILYPFNEAVRSGIEGIMVGHVAVPALDKDHPKRPAALSPVLVDELLRGRWGYTGVILSDDVARNDLVQIQSPSKAVVEALKAGCDAVLFLDPNPVRIREAVQAIQEAVDTGELSRDALEASQARLEQWRTKLGAEPPPEPEEVQVAIEEELPTLNAEDMIPIPEPVTPTEPEAEERPTLNAEDMIPIPEPNTAPEQKADEPFTVVAKDTASETEPVAVSVPETEETRILVVEKTVPLSEPDTTAKLQQDAETTESTPAPPPQEKEAVSTDIEETPESTDAMSDEDRMLLASAADAIQKKLLEKAKMEAAADEIKKMVTSTEETPESEEAPPEEEIAVEEKPAPIRVRMRRGFVT